MFLSKNVLAFFRLTRLVIKIGAFCLLSRFLGIFPCSEVFSTCDFLIETRSKCVTLMGNAGKEEKGAFLWHHLGWLSHGVPGSKSKRDTWRRGAFCSH